MISRGSMKTASTLILTFPLVLGTASMMQGNRVNGLLETNYFNYGQSIAALHNIGNITRKEQTNGIKSDCKKRK